MTSSNQVSATARNVFGEPLLVCGCKPMTGWHRDGFVKRTPLIAASTASAA